MLHVSFMDQLKIKRLEKENARFREALAQIADGDAYFDGPTKFMEIARKALEE